MASSIPVHHQARISRKRALVMVVFLLGLYLVLPQLHAFHNSLKELTHLKVKWLIVTLLSVITTYVAAAAVYYCLAIKRLKYFRTLIVQMASMFANRLLPAGVGAIGINYEYLRKQRHSPGEAGAVVAVNNTLGFIGNMLLLGGLLFFTDVRFHPKSWPSVADFVVVALVVLLLTVVLGWRKFRRAVWRATRGIVKAAYHYKNKPWRLLTSLMFSMLLTLAYAFGLYACIRALGLHLNFTEVFVSMTLGVAGGTAVPTPGGLGGAEAGIVGGLVFYGLSATDALAAALLYRLFTYWLALIAGGITFGIISRLDYF